MATMQCRHCGETCEQRSVQQLYCTTRCKRASYRAVERLERLRDPPSWRRRWVYSDALLHEVAARMRYATTGPEYWTAFAREYRRLEPEWRGSWMQVRGAAYQRGIRALIRQGTRSASRWHTVVAAMDVGDALLGVTATQPTSSRCAEVTAASGAGTGGDS